MNKIKIFAIATMLSIVCINTNAQNKAGKVDDLGRIVLNSFVSDQIEGLPSSAKKMLSNKLSQIATKNGVGGSALNPRFIITPNITVSTKDLTATSPPMTALTLEVTLYIGDGIEGTKFASESIEVKGVGVNETKAYIAAIKQIKSANPIIQDFVITGKTKIVEYYNSRCDFIIKEAQTLVAQNEFEAAILKLTSVPEVCKECFDKCMDAIVPIYKKKIDRDCKMKLQEAQGIWNASQDMEAAERAGAILSTIEPEASCFSEVKTLSNKIAIKVKQIDAREWKYILKEQAQESERIKAYRDIGVAYGNNQPKTVYNVKGWW